jgi:hypothetical protein
VIEEHGPEKIQPRYVLVFRGREPIAAIAAQVVTVTGEHLRRDTSDLPATSACDDPRCAGVALHAPLARPNRVRTESWARRET